MSVKGHMVLSHHCQPDPAAEPPLGGGGVINRRHLLAWVGAPILTGALVGGTELQS